jgi:hypothetical protein
MNTKARFFSLLLLSGSMVACMPEAPPEFKGPTTPATPQTPLPPQTPVPPGNPGLPPVTAVPVAIACGQRIETELLAGEPFSALAATCGVGAGPADHYTVQTALPAIITVDMDDTNLVNAFVLNGTACIGSGPRVQFPATPNMPYMIAVSTGVAGVGDTYDINIICND